MHFKKVIGKNRFSYLLFPIKLTEILLLALGNQATSNRNAHVDYTCRINNKCRWKTVGIYIIHFAVLEHCSIKV